MTTKRANLFLAALLTPALVLSIPAFAQDKPAEKINVLLIDGQNNHKWQETTPVLKEMLTKAGVFNVEVLTSPGAKDPKEAWDKFKPDFAKHKVVLMNYTGTPWPDEVNKAFEKYMEGGGGLVMYHAAVFAFPQWETFNKMIGMGWRDAKFGDRLTIDDSGKVVKTAKGEGPKSGHGPAHAFEMTVRQADHPVMKDMPAKWTHVKDELYHGMRGPAENITVLATAFSSKEGGGTGTNEPIVWTVPVGKGRVLVNLLGHDVPAVSAPDAAAILTRGCEWAATGQVTLPAPKEIPAPPATAPAAEPAGK
jgi:type 1 glutamine amidotransferase